MRLFEFSDADPLRVKLVAVASQLKSQDEPMTTDEFLTILNKNGISLDKSDLFDIVQKDPLKNIVADVNDDTVTFRGEEPIGTPTDTTADQNAQVRQQMASKQIQ